MKVTLPKAKSITLNPLVALVVLILTFFVGSQFGQTPEDVTTDSDAYPQTAVVERVIDGDSIVLEGDIQVRYVGISTPEEKDEFYDEASDFNRELVEGKEVRLEYDRYTDDRFGRILAYVWVVPDESTDILSEPNDDGEINMSLELARLGLANVVIYQKRAKLIWQDELLQAEQEAKSEKLGIWSK